jgi:hypothetical protein
MAILHKYGSTLQSLSHRRQRDLDIQYRSENLQLDIASASGSEFSARLKKHVDPLLKGEVT